MILCVFSIWLDYILLLEALPSWLYATGVFVNASLVRAWFPDVPGSGSVCVSECFRNWSVWSGIAMKWSIDCTPVSATSPIISWILAKSPPPPVLLLLSQWTAWLGDVFGCRFTPPCVPGLTESFAVLSVLCTNAQVYLIVWQFHYRWSCSSCSLLLVVSLQFKGMHLSIGTRDNTWPIEYSFNKDSMSTFIW